MEACAYAGDLKHEEWKVLEPLLPKSHSAGRRQTYPARRVIDAIFYLLRTGAQWRMLPHEYPPRCADFFHYAQWRKNDLWKQVTRVLRESYRGKIGRAAQPTATIIDSQSFRITEVGGPRGYDGGKKIKGRKRHVLVDTQGNLLKSMVHPADLAWLTTNPQLAKDYERLIETGEMLLYFAMSPMLLRRLTRKGERRGRRAASEAGGLESA